MTLKRFIINNLGKKVDFDRTNGPQCVDLARAYFRDVLEIEQLPALGADGSAKDFWTKHGVLKQSTDSFAPGDVLIYGATPTNPYGHVCILVSLLDSDTFIVFEQNGFEQTGAKLTVRDRTYLLGCLYK